MTPDLLPTWLMVFLRASGLLIVFPIFSTPSVPVQLRIALGAILALFITPTLPPITLNTQHLWPLLTSMSTEIAVGLLLGFVCKLLFFGLDMAGGILSTEMSMSMSTSFNPWTNSQVALPATILNLLATAIWLALDLHHWLLLAFARSYSLLPIGNASLSQPLVSQLLAWIANLFIIALLIAAPVMAVSFIITLVFAILGRAVPQMNVFAESFAVRIMAGLIVFAFTCHLMAQHIANYLNHLPHDLLRVAQLLGNPSP